MFYWVEDVKGNRILKERFQRQELFAVQNNFIEKDMLYITNLNNKLVQLELNE